MSAAVQLSFLPPAQDDLQKALRVYQESGVPHEFFNRFVRSLAVSFKSAGRGATIVAACPGSPTLDEVIIGFRKEVRRFEARNYQAPSQFEPLEVSTLSRPTRRLMELELLDRYAYALSTVRLGHLGQPRFWDDDDGTRYKARTAIGRLVTLLRTKNPPVAIIRDAQNLKCPNESNDETRAAWRLFIDIARQSGVPHIVFAPISNVKVVFDEPELVGEVQLEVLRPYSCVVASELACFKGTLHDFNLAMPWQDNDSLVSRCKEIDQAVAGDVDRLRRWIVRAMNCALSEEETSRILWRHFLQTKPLPKQRELAHEDRRTALSLLEPSAPPPPPAVEESTSAPNTKPALKPGNRKPGRDRLIEPAIL
jgi:hypothetical protein